jgi:hypothetical protein
MKRLHSLLTLSPAAATAVLGAPGGPPPKITLDRSSSGEPSSRPVIMSERDTESSPKTNVQIRFPREWRCPTWLTPQGLNPDPGHPLAGRGALSRTVLSPPTAVNRLPRVPTSALSATRRWRSRALPGNDDASTFQGERPPAASADGSSLDRADASTHALFQLRVAVFLNVLHVLV